MAVVAGEEAEVRPVLHPHVADEAVLVQASFESGLADGAGDHVGGGPLTGG